MGGWTRPARREPHGCVLTPGQRSMGGRKSSSSGKAERGRFRAVGRGLRAVPRTRRAGPGSAPHPPFPAPSSSTRRPSPRSGRQQPARCRPPPRSSALLAPPGGGCSAVRRLGFRPGAPRAPEFLPAGAPGRRNIAESREHHRAVPKAALRPRVQPESSSSELPQ